MVNYRSSSMVVMGLVMGSLFLLTMFHWLHRSDTVTGTVIADDIQTLAQIFTKIHATCHIINFDYQQNPINFLNVKSFTSSEVGPMNLAYPEKWQGPYIQDNPEVQGTHYMVVQTKQGYFITPGNGVELPNDCVIGKDIILDENADMNALMRSPNGLLYEGRPLAAHMADLGTFINPEVAELSE